METKALSVKKIISAFEEDVLFVKELIRCGDVYLFKFDCRKCKAENLTGEALGKCIDCLFSYENFVIDVSKVRLKRNVVAKPMTRQRRGINKNTASKIFDSQDWKCIYCQCDLRGGLAQATIDHIYPFSVGGRNHLSNLVGACGVCNIIASDKIFPNLLSKISWVQNKLLIRSRRH